MRPRIVIIGAGMAGLVAASMLARHANVTVLEQGDTFGGKIQTRTIGQMPVDCGPTVLTLPHVFETIFRDSGGNLHDQVRLSRLETLARHFWNGGASLDLFSDLDQSVAAISEFSSPAEADNYVAFTRKASNVFQTLASSFLLAPKPDFLKLITSRSVTRLWGLSPFASLWQELTRQFDDPRLIQLFARYATYCGASPFSCPATLMLVADVERQGVWRLDGGLTELAQALADLAKRNTATFQTNAAVEAIEFHDKKPVSVRLTNQTRVPADAVICAGDVNAVARGHFGSEAAKALGRQAAGTRSQSAMTWTFSAAANGPDLSHHNVFFSDDYAAEFKSVFEEGEVPVDPTVYLCAPERGPSSAMFTLINAPPNGDTKIYSDEEVQQCQAQMSERLRACGLTLSIDPDTLQSSSPNAFARRFPGTGGALYGPASHGWSAAFKRQGVRTRRRGFYLAGGSIHPGPGLPMAALSGRAAALEALSDFDLTTPQQLAAMRGGISMA